MNYKKLKILILFYIFFGNVSSQQLSNLNNNDQPIEIFAEEGIEWHKNRNKYVAIGNAKAISGSLSLKSEKIEAFYRRKKFRHEYKRS